MANLLKMDKITDIRSLHQQGLSQRGIAKKLEIDRETVARHLRQTSLPSPPTLGPVRPEHGDPKPANAPIGSAPGHDAPKPATAPTCLLPVDDPSKPATLPTDSTLDHHGLMPAIALVGSGLDSGAAMGDHLSTSVLALSGSQLHPAELLVSGTDQFLPPLPIPSSASACEPWRNLILHKFDCGLSAQRIFQDIRDDHDFKGSYYSVRRFLHPFRHTPELPFRRIESEPGYEAQVDFGTGALIIDPNGFHKKTHVLRVVLSYSRKSYSESLLRQTTDGFLQALKNAFEYFGGVPRRIVIDNLKAAVTKADWYDPDLNPKIGLFAQHYGTVFMPTRPRMPEHKGKVERGVDYVQENALKGRTFASLQEQNQFLRHWESTVADDRIHGTTHRHVGQDFQQNDKPALLALPATPYEPLNEGRRTVHRDGHVSVDRAYYSAPPEYVGLKVWVRWDERTVRIFNDRFEQIAIHPKQTPGRFSTLKPHIPSAKVCHAERGIDWLLDRARLLGPHAASWAQAVTQHRNLEAPRVLTGLLSLANHHPVAAIERACQDAVNHGVYHLRTIRELVDRDQAQRDTVSFISSHIIIRQLSEYDQFIKESNS